MAVDSSILELAPPGTLPAFFVLSALYVVWHAYNVLGATHLPSHIPWASGSKTWFEKVKANARDIVDGGANIKAGHEKYSRHGKVYVLPSITFDPSVIVPSQYLDWFVSVPEDILDVRQTQIDIISLKYIQTTSTVKGGQPFDFLHEVPIRKDLTRQLGNLLPEVTDELHTSTEHYWGSDTKEFRSVQLADTLGQIIGRTTNRIIVGLPLCRDEDYLHATEQYALGVGKYGITLNVLCPRVLKPLLGPLFVYPCTSQGRKFHKMLKPLAQKRLDEYYQRQQDPENFKGDARPKDFLSWLVAASASTGDAGNMDADKLCTRLGFVQFAAIHTTSSALTQVILELSSGEEEEVNDRWRIIREEAKAVLAEEGGKWTRDGLRRMVKTDSVLRESLRLNGTGGVGIMRKVVAKEGLTLPTGDHLPRGTMVSMNARQHFEADNYEDPMTFKPFRFAELRENASSDGATANNADDFLMKKNLGATTVGENFMSFSCGPHACPGRFFAVQEMKVLLAYIALHYDIEPMAERPANMLVSTLVVPPPGAAIRVRRRVN